jgi:hypothetical protein
MPLGTNCLKGAIIQFSAPMLLPIPNVILFQYNPESMTRTLTPWAPTERTYDEHGGAQSLTWMWRNALAQPYDPQEMFNLTLFLDATDALEDPDSNRMAVRTGIADRIAALEMLLYPPGDSAVGGLLGTAVDVSISGAGISATTGIDARIAQRRSVPVILFVWGPGRIVPVRLLTFSVEEILYNPALYPIRAKVNLGMRVLDETDMITVEGTVGATTASVKLAKACYALTRVKKELLATASISGQELLSTAGIAAGAVASTVQSVISLLPS